LLASAVALHVAATCGRAYWIDFFPLTNKFESFSAAGLCVTIVALATWGAGRTYASLVLGVGIAALTAALGFPLDMGYPPPLMRTVWYPLHVPLSFFAYGCWTAAAAGGVMWLAGRDPEWLGRIDRMALRGFGLWSLSMIAGGLWGVVAWGAYFLWDAKILWSVVLWFHYATFIHVRMAPSLNGRPWVRPVLALLGLLWVFVAYVGTSFFFGSASHAF
jgi:ABC-type transport system involved in cytochrome c biogenesis permease subunit